MSVETRVRSTGQVTGSGGGGSGSLSIGSAVSGGGANLVLYEDASQNLAASVNNFFDGTNFRLGGTGGINFTAAVGILTIAGIGNTNNENLTIDLEGTSNRVTFGSGTGVVTYSFQGGQILLRDQSATASSAMVDVSGSNSTTSSLAGMRASITNTNAGVTAPSFGGNFTGIKSATTGGNTSTLVGVKGTASYSSTGTQTDAIGVWGLASKITSASGAISDAYGVFGSIPTASGGGTVTRGWGIGTDGSIGFTSALGTAPDVAIARNAAGVLDFQYDTSNYLRLTVSSAGFITFDAVGPSHAFSFVDPVEVTTINHLTITDSAGTLTIGDNASNVVAFFPQGATVTINSAGTTTVTLPPVGTLIGVVASGRLTAQTAAQASVATYTVGSTDGSFEISSNVNVTTATAHSFTVTCVYTDETNTSRTLTLGFTQLAGATFLSSITNITGAGPYESPSYHIRAKTGTSITIATVGTFTTVTYNVEGTIKQIA